MGFVMLSISLPSLLCRQNSKNIFPSIDLSCVFKTRFRRSSATRPKPTKAFPDPSFFNLLSYLIPSEVLILGAYSKVPQKSTVSTTKSEFEELEAVPSMDVMDGPLEPSSSTASNIADAPDDHAFVNFFSAASHTAVAGQAYQSSTISVPLHQVGFAPSTLSNMHRSSPPQLSTAPSVPFLDVPESHSNTNLATSLVKPSSFFVTPPSPATVIAPVSSSVPSAPLFQPAVSLQRPYGAPLLQPFPPPAPPPSLTPASFSTSNYGPLISRDKVRDALRLLVQDNQFVDMVHLALLKAHHS